MLLQAVVMCFPAPAADKPGVRPGREQSDVAVAQPADNVGRRAVRVVQPYDLTDALAASAVCDHPVAHLGLHPELSLVRG
jgi:hypothetical protein